MSASINRKLGRSIQQVRKKKGITQEKLAELTKTSYKYIQRIEGKTPPDVRLTTIEKIAKALRIKPSKLLE